MSRVAPFDSPDGPASAPHARSPIGELSRSLVGKLVLLLIVFATVPVILYSEFHQADTEKRTLLLENVRAQGRLITESLRPLLARGDPSPLPDLNEAIKPFATESAGIKVLFRPAGESGLEGFFFVASEPPVPAATLTAERDRLMERGVLDKLAQSCEGQIPMALRHRKESGEQELLTSITPVTTIFGCWAVITTHTAREMLGTAIDQPYWMTIEVQVAAAIYLAMALFTLAMFFSIWRGLMRFRDLARGIGAGHAEGPGFAARNEVPELAEVAEEFDRMTGALRDSAESLRRAAEDNAHAFKTPIAILRQSIEPLKRMVPDGISRGRRALEVIEESVDRLDQLVTGARRLDQAAAELLDAPRQRVDLSRLIERLLDAYGDGLAARGLTIDRRVASGIVVRAGEEMLETVVENVMDNAIEVAPGGSALDIELVREGQFAVLTVGDRGPGVAPENLERIFERYISLREPRAPGNADGAAHMGIGLWIVRRNVQATGGTVSAQNRAGGGLSVILRLPLAGRPA